MGTPIGKVGTRISVIAAAITAIMATNDQTSKLVIGVLAAIYVIGQSIVEATRPRQDKKTPQGGDAK